MGVFSHIETKSPKPMVEGKGRESGAVWWELVEWIEALVTRSQRVVAIGSINE